MTQDSFFHILSYEGLPQESFDEFESDVSQTGLTVHRTERSPPVFASLAVLIPPAVIVVLTVGLSAYVKAFATELGKSHAQLVDAALRKLGRRILGPEGPDVTLIGTKGKVPTVPKYSHRFGLVADFGEGHQIRLVFAPGEDPADAISSFLSLIEQLNGPDTGEIPVAGDPGTGHNGIFVRYDATVSGLVFINPMASPRTTDGAAEAGQETSLP